MADYTFLQNSDMQEALQKMLSQRTLPDSLTHFQTPSMPEIESVPLQEYFAKTEEYQKRSLEVLKSIEENTANLSSIVDLINHSNENQDQIIEIFTDILSIAKAKNKEEADGLFKNVSEKITSTTDTVDAIIKLTGWATTVYKIVVPLLQSGV